MQLFKANAAARDDFAVRFGGIGKDSYLR